MLVVSLRYPGVILVPKWCPRVSAVQILQNWVVECFLIDFLFLFYFLLNDFLEFARRPSENTIFGRPGAVLGALGGHLGAILGIIKV